MKTRTVHIGGNAVAAAGRDVYINTLNIGLCPHAAESDDDTQTQLNSLMADFTCRHNGNTPLTALNSGQIRQMANYCEKLEKLITSARKRK